MAAGTRYEDPRFTYEDSYSHRQIQQLTDYLGHSNHLYFTDPCWIADNEEMVFTSDRHNQSNLFRYRLSDGRILQMTDLSGRGRPTGSFSTRTGCHTFWWQNSVLEVDVGSFQVRCLYEPEPGFVGRGQAAPTADGTYVCILMMEMPEQERPRISFAYSRFREFFHARPLTRIVRVHRETGVADIIHEDRCYMGHINTSPISPNVLTFCHEGPWDLVDQRIWGLNTNDGSVWKIRPQEGEQIAVGHEYWFADGERIGYHGHRSDGSGLHVFGHVRWDDTDRVEVEFPFRSTHFHSLDETMIVGDGTPAYIGGGTSYPFIQLFRWDGERYEGPKILAYNRSTFNDQHAHCHPRLLPNGDAVLYTSDLTGYSNMYLAPIGDFDDLPDLRQDERVT
jgi:oligogalacturonide lyase